MQCSCRVTRDLVMIPLHCEDHVIRRHFQRIQENGNLNAMQAFFLPCVSPYVLFNHVVDSLRSGYFCRWRRSGHGRYYYYLEYPFNIGVFPYFFGGPRATRIVKIVCDYVVCQFCWRHCPATVVTIFPCLEEEYENVPVAV